MRTAGFAVLLLLSAASCYSRGGDGFEDLSFGGDDDSSTFPPYSPPPAVFRFLTSTTNAGAYTGDVLSATVRQDWPSAVVWCGATTVIGTSASLQSHSAVFAANVNYSVRWMMDVAGDGYDPGIDPTWTRTVAPAAEEWLQLDTNVPPDAAGANACE